MVLKMSRSEAENWAYRADVAEQAIRNRHASALWGLPRTNLAIPSWPAPLVHKLFFNWNYWWQAHYVECLVDASERLPSKEKFRAISHAIRAIRVRNLAPLSSNNYYDDRAWMAIALLRTKTALGRKRPKKTARKLLQSLIDGIDPSFGVLPWREGDLFFNVPANGPAAIALARAGELDLARQLVDWVFENTLSDSGLLYDGIRRDMTGSVVQKGIFSYNQGVMIGACLELALRLRDAGDREAATAYLTKTHNLIHAVAKDLAGPDNVITGAGGGDGGLFNGILARYLADAAIRLPQDDRISRAAARIARRLVLASANKAWHHRLEVDGLPLFPADWTKDAKFPQGGGVVAASISGAVHGSSIKERDFSVQCSGWMLMEAAARVALDLESKTKAAEKSAAEKSVQPAPENPRPECN